jgi:hypothetical protein
MHRDESDRWMKRKKILTALDEMAIERFPVFELD